MHIKFFLVSFFVYCYAFANAQISVGIHPIKSDYNKNIYPVSGINFKSGVEIDIGYIERLKEKRIDFFPSLSLLTKRDSITVSFGFLGAPYKLGNIIENDFHLNLMIRVFLFDFNGINHPRKMMNMNKKIRQGLFVFSNTSLGIIYQKYTLRSDLFFGLVAAQNSYYNTVLRLGIGIGYETAINQSLSISVDISTLAYKTYPNEYLIDLMADCGFLCLTDSIQNSDDSVDDVIQTKLGITIHYNMEKSNLASKRTKKKKLKSYEIKKNKHEVF